MAEIVELVAEKTVARAVEIRKKNARASSGYRSVRLARKEASEVALPEGPPAAPKEPDVAKRVVVGEFGSPASGNLLPSIDSPSLASSPSPNGTLSSGTSGCAATSEPNSPTTTLLATSGQGVLAGV